jgi:hypothetical protein
MRPSSQDEYRDYTEQPPYDIGKMSALVWWGQEPQRKRWPRLSLMALDILSIPAMSDEAERVFSGARRTISWERAQMCCAQQTGMHRMDGSNCLIVYLTERRADTYSYESPTCQLSFS